LGWHEAKKAKNKIKNAAMILHLQESDEHDPCVNKNKQITLDFCKNDAF